MTVSVGLESLTGHAVGLRSMGLRFGGFKVTSSKFPRLNFRRNATRNFIIALLAVISVTNSPQIVFGQAPTPNPITAGTDVQRRNNASMGSTTQSGSMGAGPTRQGAGTRFNDPNMWCKSSETTPGTPGLVTERCVDGNFLRWGARPRDNPGIFAWSAPSAKAEGFGTKFLSNQTAKHLDKPKTLFYVTTALTEPSIQRGLVDAEQTTSEEIRDWRESERDFKTQCERVPFGVTLWEAYQGCKDRYIAGRTNLPGQTDLSGRATQLEAIARCLPGTKDELVDIGGVPISPWGDIATSWLIPINPTNLGDNRNHAVQNPLAGTDAASVNPNELRLTSVIFNQELRPDGVSAEEAARTLEQTEGLRQKKALFLQLVGDAVLTMTQDTSAASGQVKTTVRTELANPGPEYTFRAKTRAIYETVMDVLFRYCIYKIRAEEDSCGPGPTQKPCWDPNHTWSEPDSDARNPWRFAKDSYNALIGVNSVTNDFFGSGIPGTADSRTAQEVAFIQASSAEIALDEGTVVSFWDLYKSIAPQMRMQSFMTGGPTEVIDCRYLDKLGGEGLGANAQSPRLPSGPMIFNMGDFDLAMEGFVTDHKQGSELVRRVFAYSQTVAESQLLDMLKDLMTTVNSLTAGRDPWVQEESAKLIYSAAKTTNMSRIDDTKEELMKQLVQASDDTQNKLPQTARGGSAGDIGGMYRQGSGGAGNPGSGGLGGSQGGT